MINKPAGMTSFDVIARLRRQYGQKKFGHAGTLDPMASGVLVVLAGKAAKILPYLKDTRKEYIASVRFGAQYDTDDITGTLEKTAPVNPDFDFQNELNTFLGPLHQLVPKASAKKVNGKKLYEYLRAGQPVPEVYTDVEIDEIEALENDEQTGDRRFRVTCSSGTYVRSLCRDLGLKTGNLAAMSALQRTRANGFSLEEADELDAKSHRLYPIDCLLDYEKVQTDDPSSIKSGKKVHLQAKSDTVLVMDGEQALAIYSRIWPDHDVFASQRGLF